VRLLLILAVIVFGANFIVWRMISRVVGGGGTGAAPAKAIVGRRNEGPQICTEVDVVYTWVNGSDPAHKELLRQYGKSWDAGFRDYGQPAHTRVVSCSLFTPTSVH
jgi:hypothetical protein